MQVKATKFLREGYFSFWERKRSCSENIIFCPFTCHTQRLAYNLIVLFCSLNGFVFRMFMLAQNGSILTLNVFTCQFAYFNSKVKSSPLILTFVYCFLRLILFRLEIAFNNNNNSSNKWTAFIYVYNLYIQQHLDNRISWPMYKKEA